MNRRPRSALVLDVLESRLAPAGTVVGSVTAGVLTLTGDDAGNVIQLAQAGTTITVTGDATTTIVGGPTFSNVTAIWTVLNGGDDEVSLASPAFSLAGFATFDVGDGNNSLNLVATDRLSLGPLLVKAGDGDDVVALSGAADSEVRGNAFLNLGPGDTTVSLNSLTVRGPIGLSAIAKDGNDSLTLTAVTVPGAVTLFTGNGQLNVDVVGGTLGSLSLAAVGGRPDDPAAGVNLDLGNATVTGPVRLSSLGSARVNIVDSVSTGSMSVAAGRLGTATLDVGNSPFPLRMELHGGLTVRGKQVNVYVRPGVSLEIAGGVALLGTHGNSLAIEGGLLVTHYLRVFSSPLAATASLSRVTIDSAEVSVLGDISVSGASVEFSHKDFMLTCVSLSLAATGAVKYLQGEDGAENYLLASQLLSVRAGTTVDFQVLGGRALVEGNLSLSGTTQTDFDLHPEASIHVRGSMGVHAGPGNVGLDVTGALLVENDLTVRAQSTAAIALAPSAVPNIPSSAIARNLYLALGPQDDVVSIGGGFSVDGALTVNAGAGNNSVTLGRSAADLRAPRLFVSSLGGNDIITLNRVDAGLTSIRSGGGRDVLDIIGPSQFGMATTIDLGAGDDICRMASDPATTTGPVTFNAAATVRMGAGNDLLRLGLAGDPNARVQFGPAGSLTVDGGLNLNVFDNEAGQFDASKVTTLNFVDPNDP